MFNCGQLDCGNGKFYLGFDACVGDGVEVGRPVVDLHIGHANVGRERGRVDVQLLQEMVR